MAEHPSTTGQARAAPLLCNLSKNRLSLSLPPVPPVVKDSSNKDRAHYVFAISPSSFLKDFLKYFDVKTFHRPAVTPGCRPDKVLPGDTRSAPVSWGRIALTEKRELH